MFKLKLLILQYSFIYLKHFFKLNFYISRVLNVKMLLQSLLLEILKVNNVIVITLII